MGEFEVWNEEGRYIGSYTPYDYALGFSCGYKILKDLGIGLNIKYIYSFLVPDWVVNGGTGITFAIDLGVLNKRKIKNYLEINNAFVVKNLGPKIGYIPGAEKDPLPYGIIIGNSIKFKYINLFINKDIDNWLIKYLLEKSYILFSYDLRQDLYFEGKPWHSFGFEFSLGPFFLNRGYFEDIDGWQGGVIVKDEDDEYKCISIFEYLFRRLFGRKVELVRIQAPTWSFGLDFKFLRIEYGSDAKIYSFWTENNRFTISLNLGTPILDTPILKW